MFTGLISDIGVVTTIKPFSGGLRWSIHAPRTAAQLAVGDSVNISGACQTVESTDGKSFSGSSIQETLLATNFRTWKVGRRVNLELALRASDRFGGHFVTGHVDTTGRAQEIRRGPEGHWVDITFDEKCDRWVLRKGSIAVDGVSLTVMEKKSGMLTISFIPETVAKTTLGELKSGDTVNLEFDMLVKAVIPELNTGTVSEELLTRSGW